MRIDVVTLFPSMFEGVIGESILKLAQDKGKVEIRLHNLRDFSADKHKKVDAPPYGGGPGMLLMAEPFFNAVEFLRENGARESQLLMLTPTGVRFEQSLAQELASKPGLILLCGHYEGVDERVVEGLKPLEVSIGDFVTTGGEVPAMLVMDAVARLVPGVLGSAESLERESFAGGRLEHPQYTRPPEVQGMEVPTVLLSGDHGRIEDWRREESEKRTKSRRPDLLRVVRKKKYRQL